MFVAVFIIFLGQTYRVAPLPNIYPSLETCEIELNNFQIKLSVNQPDNAFVMGECVSFGVKV